MLSRLVISFLLRSKCLLISWLQSPSAVILEPQKIRSDTVSTVSPSISHEVIGCHDLHFLNVELQASFFTLHFHFPQEAFQFLFIFCHKDGVMMEYYLTIKKNEIMPLVATQMDLEMIILREVSQTEKDKYYMTSLICGT